MTTKNKQIVAGILALTTLAWSGLFAVFNGHENKPAVQPVTQSEMLGGSTAFGNAGGGNWTKYSKLEINYTKASGTVDLIDYPLLLTEANFPAGIFTNAQESGCDIRFGSTTDATPSDSSTFEELAFEKVGFATSTSQAEIYVKIPVLSVTATTTFYVVYGNPSATCNAATDTYGRNNTWTNYAAVFHLNDATNSVGGTNMTEFGSPTYTTGQIGNALDLGTSNSTKYLSADTNYGIINGTTTQQTWVKIRTEPSNASQNFVYIGANNPGYLGQYTRYVDTAGAKTLAWTRTKKSIADQTVSVSVSALGTTDWHQVIYRFSAAESTLSLIYDKEKIGSVTASGNGTNAYSNKSTIGAGRNSASGVETMASAYIDEVRYSAKAISFAQAEMEYLNQTDPASFTSYNPEGNFGGSPAASDVFSSILEDQ